MIRDRAGRGSHWNLFESNNYLCNSVAYKWHTVLLRWSQKVNWQPQTFQITAKCIIGTMRKSQPSHQPLLMNTCTVMSICIIFLVYVLYNLVMGINSVNSSIVHDVLQCLRALLFFHPILVPYWLAALEILYGKERKRSSQSSRGTWSDMFLAQHTLVRFQLS